MTTAGRTRKIAAMGLEVPVNTVGEEPVVWDPAGAQEAMTTNKGLNRWATTLKPVTQTMTIGLVGFPMKIVRMEITETVLTTV